MPNLRKEKGDAAEQIVARWLQARGAMIVARNLRLGALEIDIVAREQEVVLVVEVRTRGPGAFTSGLASLSPTKRKRVRRAGQRLWDRRYRRDPTAQRMRFDVAIVSFQTDPPTLEYVKGAF